MADTPTREELAELVKHVRWLATLPEIAHYKDKHQRIITLLSTLPPAAAGGVPTGWKLVPLDLTPAMWAAGKDISWPLPNIYGDISDAEKIDAALDIYHAMLAAAPPHPDTEDGR